MNDFVDDLNAMAKQCDPVLVFNRSREGKDVDVLNLPTEQKMVFVLMRKVMELEARLAKLHGEPRIEDTGD